ncbi:MAG: putative membrane protein YkoI [Enterobacterales bacterium]|jgi:uncharacterized membrane protein YkoI
MKTLSTLILTACLFSSFVSAEPISEDEVIQKAISYYPGEVLDIYQETKEGVEVWRVTIENVKGEVRDFYYSIETGELVDSEIKVTG